MRIIAGKYKKINLDQTIDKSIRPLKDSAKEGIFNVLTHSTKLIFDSFRMISSVTRKPQLYSISSMARFLSPSALLKSLTHLPIKE